MSFFGGNPFSTPVGQMIEQATDASLASENWALNMEICDLINENEDGPKDAIKAIRKRLQQNAGKNYTVVMYTLTVLETCVKNCERRFHLLATNKEFVQELVKLIGPKNDPPTAVQEKVLSLIQSWADAFKIIPEMSGVVQVYQDLKQKGVEFPMTDLDSLAPIHTPQRVSLLKKSVPEVEQPVRQPRAPPTRLAAGVTAPGVPSPTAGTGSVTLTAEQLAKLRSELDVVQGNMNVFSEMLTELSPGQEHPSDLELLQDLNKTCKSMQVRIVELIDKVGNEEVTNELLRINDDLNNIFLRYARFEKNRSQSHQLSPGHTETNQVKTPEESPLIDLSEEAPGSQSDIHLRLAGLSVGPGNVSSTLSQMNTVTAQQGKGAEDEFDMFAQSRTATYEKSKQTGSTYQDNSNVDQVNASLGAIAQNRLTPSKLQSEKDFDEMEAWLEGKPTGAAPDSQQDSITSSVPTTKNDDHQQEFDRFLADRAAAAENLPSTNSTPSRSAGRRQIEKDEAENTLFAL